MLVTEAPDELSDLWTQVLSRDRIKIVESWSKIWLHVYMQGTPHDFTVNKCVCSIHFLFKYPPDELHLI